MILTEFRTWHATALGPRDVEWGPELAARANTAMLGGPAMTLLSKDKEIVACFGIVLVTRCAAEAWALIGDDIKHHKIALHKSVTWCLKEAHKRYGIQRMQATISEDRPTARKWALGLGFGEESRLKKFGHDGETFIRYVRFY